MNPTVDVVIVNYKSSELTIKCLESLLIEKSTCTTHSVRTVIVENNSQDQNIDKLKTFITKSEYKEWVFFIELNLNKGFGAGNNEGIRFFERLSNRQENDSYFFFLNPDTLLLPQCLSKLLTFSTSNKQVTIVGPQHFDSNRHQVHSAFRFPNLLNTIDNSINFSLISNLFQKHSTIYKFSKTPHPVEWISGAAMLIRKSSLKEIGFFDEHFFLYFEEVDLCKRAINKGFQIWQIPDAHLIHLKGESSGIKRSQNQQKRIPEYWHKSRRLFLEKHYGIKKRILYDFIFLTGSALEQVKEILKLRIKRHPPFFFIDFLKYSLMIDKFIEKDPKPF